MSQLMILDSMIIFELFKLNMWDRFTKYYQIKMPKSLAAEINHYRNDRGEQIPIDFQALAGRDYTLIEGLPADRVERGKAVVIRELGLEIHVEMEAILIIKDNSDINFCTADKAAILTMGSFGLSDQSISFERACRATGFTPPSFSKLGTFEENKFRLLLNKGSAEFPRLHEKLATL